MNRLGEDANGLWLWSPPGSPMRRGDEPVRHSKTTNVKLLPAAKWWTAIWSWERDDALYVDIITPPDWRGATVTMVDIDLDVVRWADGRVEVVDADEFEVNQNRYGYPPRLVDTARATAARLAVALENRHEPFGNVGDVWLAKAVRLAG